jgi:hypothetical protein
VPSVYNLYSGYAHGYPFALGREHVQDAMRYQPLVNEDSFKGAVAVASYALYPPGARLSELFGLDSPWSERATSSVATTERPQRSRRYGSV